MINNATVRQALEASAEFTSEQIESYIKEFEHQEGGVNPWADNFSTLDEVVEDASLTLTPDPILLAFK